MLYVFVGSSGTMMKFDMNLAVKKVSELKNEIYRMLGIPVEDQVLLCSGGEELKPDNIVGNYYGAGTDTNPIFLFSKFAHEAELPFEAQLKTSVDLSIENDVRGCVSMTPNIQAATVRSSLAQRFAESAVSGKRECDELVHGQHLQQQGWAAVIANLDDAKDALLKRKTHFEDLFQKYLSNRSSYQETIKMFPDDIDLLAKIPLLPKLTIGWECSEEDLKSEHTLLSWFCSEPQSVLETLIDKCQHMIEELNEHSLIRLNDDLMTVLKTVENPDIKEVKGIEERLSSLNRQIEDAKKLEKDQRDLATWFVHTQSTIARDPHALPDLCKTFQNQLELMLHNHKCLRTILERCTKAKMEFCDSINVRVKYICRVESDMYDLQMRITFLEKHVQSVMNQIESFHQVHLAPQRYVKLLAEVCRRKVFSASFIKWASELSTQASKLYEKEVLIRKGFTNDKNKNMVDNLFPGMDDVPPPFAVECPQTFDQKLPSVLKEDLEWLKFRFPGLSDFCEVLPPEPMPYVSHTESDSAISSNVPSSRLADYSDEKPPEKIEGSPHKIAVPPSGDFSSLPSECASLPNELFSLASSPFEDPLLRNSELTAKRTKFSSQYLRLSPKGTSAERLESDGEEFETLDFGSSPLEIVPRDLRHARPSSSSEANLSLSPRMSKDAISPLKSPDSTDFQNAEYYIDDSMPSSYTESNATSPLPRGGRMVKSRHTVLSELQRQVEEKNTALHNTLSSPEQSDSKLLKVHSQMSALQKCVQEVQGSLQADLSQLKSYVKGELSGRMVDVSHLIRNLNLCVEKMQLLVSEKEVELTEARSECDNLKNTSVHQLEVERQKLEDAENQVACYEEHIRAHSEKYIETEHEREQLAIDLQDKNELIKRMMLEHELELDSRTSNLKKTISEMDSTNSELKQSLSDVQTQVECLQKEKQNISSDYEDNLEKLHSTFLEMQDEQRFLKRELQQLKDCSNVGDVDSKREDKIKAINDKMHLMKTLLSIEDAQKIIYENEEKWESEKIKLIEVEQAKWKALLEESARKENIMAEESKNKAISSLRLEHDEALEKLKSRITAENQVSFNEAINSLAKQKDAIIEELRSQKSVTDAKSMAMQSYLDGVTSEFTAGTSFPSKHPSGSVSNTEEQMISQISEPQIETEPLTENAELGENVCHLVDLKTVGNLKERLKRKEEECENLLSKFNDVSQTTSPCFHCGNKISILSCNTGENVLVCYEEKHENYIVYHFGRFLHFLHTDSLTTLNLKIPPETSERFIVGVVTYKELCVTKKENNRYKVSMGTKFYRVRVKPWDREITLGIMYKMHRSSHQGNLTKTMSIQSTQSDDSGSSAASSRMSSSVM